MDGIDATTLFVGTTMLTGITDNAALTYLGTQVDGLSIDLKYALVAGAVAGGGLTVIANAPNPAGFGILKDSFGEDGISPVGLLKNSIVPTIIAMLCLWFMGAPKEPAGAGSAKALLVDVVEAGKYKVDSKEYDFVTLKDYLKKKAEISGGKLKLVLMLPEEQKHGDHTHAYHVKELQKLLQDVNSEGVEKVKSGQIILNYDLNPVPSDH